LRQSKTTQKVKHRNMKINKTLTAIGAAISVFSNTAVADEKTYFINGTTLERETVYAQWHNAIKNIESRLHNAITEARFKAHSTQKPIYINKYTHWYGPRYKVSDQADGSHSLLCIFPDGYPALDHWEVKYPTPHAIALKLTKLVKAAEISKL